ncbi:hypothetical protein AB0I22_38475 [Streptomyces sp. NPDC050610]|uniref:hypothetical protein n=1 Tax=Streptomyces sp. NPDC050610 TaxID=3157097 RepID=UPI0034233120
MSNQPHDPYDPYDPNRPHEPYPPQHPNPPYGQQEPYAPQGTYGGPESYGGQEPGAWPAPGESQQYQQPQQAQQQPYYPAQQDGYQGGYQDEHTQTWAGPTWDTRTWQTLSAPAAPAAEPGGLPPEQGQGQYETYGTGTGAYGTGHSTGHGQYQEAPAGQAAWRGDQSPAAHAAPGAYGDPYAPMNGGPNVQRPQQAQMTPPAPQTAQAAQAAQAAQEDQAPERPLTAAEKARAEGRPQILAPGIRPAAITAVLAVLLAVTAPLPRPVLAVPVVLLQAVTAAGWFRLNGMWPARQGIALAFLAGLVADIGLLATDADQAPTVLIGTIGVWILLVLVLQLRSRSTPDERLYGLTAAAAASGLAVLAAGHLAADSDAVVVGALAVAVAVLASALPLPSAASPVVALVAAAGAGVAAGQLTGIGPSGALLGAAAGVCALVGLRVASYDYPSRFVHLTAGVALPLAAAAPAVYVIGRALA